VKIGLVDPRTGELAEESFPHLGIGYLGSRVAEIASSVRILDRRVAGQAEQTSFLQERFDLVGISAASFTFEDAIDFARKVKTYSPETRVVLGGPHVSVTMQGTFTDDAVDFAVYGEGEETFPELVRALEHGAPDLLSSVPGLLYREGDRIVHTPPRHPRLGQDEIPFPCFHLFPMETYSTYPLMTSRGCPFRCVYCCCHLLWGKKPRFRSPEHIVREIRHARERFSWEHKEFVILDDTFNLQPARVEAFCDLLIRERMNIRYHVWGFRADLAPLPMLKKLKASGCDSVSIGIESANEEVLRRIRKGESLAQIVETLRNLKKAGIYPVALFMIGNPGDTLQTARETMAFAKKNRLYLSVFNMALPYPETDLWTYVKKSGTFLRDDFIHFHHYSSEPIFETPDFPAADRIRAYRLARRFERVQRIKFEIMRKAEFVRRGDFRDLSWDRVVRSARRLHKYLLDLLFQRKPEEKL
jgi:anaerobic magnesium-protoporphyrin IX monomethyl ester cyclase